MLLGDDHDTAVAYIMSWLTSSSLLLLGQRPLYVCSLCVRCNTGLVWTLRKA
jgi:hypothetical protein